MSSLLERFRQHPQGNESVTGEQTTNTLLGQPQTKDIIADEPSANALFRENLARSERDTWSELLGTEIPVPNPPEYLSEKDVSAFQTMGYQVLFMPRIEAPRNEQGLFDRQLFTRMYPGLAGNVSVELLWDYLVSGRKSALAGNYVAVEQSPALRDTSSTDEGYLRAAKKTFLEEFGIQHLSAHFPKLKLDIPDFVLLSAGNDFQFRGSETTATKGLTFVGNEQNTFFDVSKESDETFTRAAFVLPQGKASSYQVELPERRRYYRGDSPEAFLADQLIMNPDFVTRYTERVAEFGLSGASGIEEKFLDTTASITIDPIDRKINVEQITSIEDPLTRQFLKRVYDVAYVAGKTVGNREGSERTAEALNDSWRERMYGPSDPTR